LSLSSDWEVRDTCWVCSIALGRMLPIESALCRRCGEWREELAQAIRTEMRLRGLILRGDPAKDRFARNEGP
jgi:hypothetical protein